MEMSVKAFEDLAQEPRQQMEQQMEQPLETQMSLQKDEFDSLEVTKDTELQRVEQELQEANNEIYNLRLDAEEVAILHENEITDLQEQLCKLKLELDQVQCVRNENYMELAALRAMTRMKRESVIEARTIIDEPQSEEKQLSNTPQEVDRLRGELQTLRAQYLDLKEEFQSLQASNNVMVHQLEKLEALKYKFRNRSEDSPSVESISQWPSDRRYSIIKQPTNQKSSCVSFRSVEIVGVASDYSNEERMEKVDEENEQDQSHQLVIEEEKVEMVQTSGIMTRCHMPVMKNEDQPFYQEQDFRRRQRRRRDSERIVEEDVHQHGQAEDTLHEMESKFQHSQMERELLQEELRLCKEEIERLNGSIPVGGRVPAGGMKPLALFVILAGGLILKRLSNRSLT